MGGSARETTNRGIEFQSAVQTDSGGQYILPGKTNKIYNHTYAIVDLKASTVSYYEVPGWEPSDPNPDKTCPPNPLLVTKL